MRPTIALATTLFFLNSICFAQTSSTKPLPFVSTPQVSVPRLIRISGSISTDGQPRTTGVTFAIYADEKGDGALWQEVQNVSLDAAGHYSVLLGSSSSEGLPLDLFTSGEARWLGIEVQGEPEQPRTLLVAVPYALKAADAETLGGKPASAFLTTEQLNSNPLSSTVSGVKVQGSVASGGVPLSANVTGSGSQNVLPKFDASGTNLVNSAVTETNGNVGIGTASPNAKLSFGSSFGTPAIHLFEDVPTVRYGFGINGNELQSFFPSGAHFSFNGGGDMQASGTNELMRIQGNGNVGIGTTNPGARLSFGTSLVGRPAIHLYDGVPSVRYGFGINGNELQSFFPQGAHFSFNTAGDMQASGVNEVMRIQGNGSVGIGTTNPGQKLSVAGTIESTAGGFKFPDGSIQGSAGGSTFYIQNGTGVQNANFNISGNGTIGGMLTVPSNGFAAANSQFVLATDRVGIGTSSPGAFLHILQPTPLSGAIPDALRVEGGVGGVSNGNGLVGAGITLKSGAGGVGNSGGPGGSISITTGDGGASNTGGAGGSLSLTTGAGGSGSITGLPGGSITITAGNGGVGSVEVGSGGVGGGGGNITLAPGSGGTAATPGSVGNIILAPSLGSVGIGTFPATKLQVFGDIRVGNNGSNGCIQNFAGNVIAGTCSSDVRLKMHIRPFGPVLDKLARLHPVNFEWRVSQYPEYHFGPGVNIGLIAQDVERIFPEMVSVDANGFKMVNYSELPYLMLQAFKELRAENSYLKQKLPQRQEIDQLKSENHRLQQQLTSLEERFDAIMKKLETQK